MENDENIELNSQEEEVEESSFPEEEDEAEAEIEEEELEESSLPEEEDEAEADIEEEEVEESSVLEEEVEVVSVRKGESNEEIQSEDVSTTSIDYTPHLEAMQTDIRLNSLALIALIIFLGLVHGFKKL